MRTKPNNLNYQRHPSHRVTDVELNPHDFSACRVKIEHCRKCEKMGHIQRVCRFGKAQQKSKRKQNYFCEEYDDTFVASLDINKVDNSNSKIIWVTTRLLDRL